MDSFFSGVQLHFTIDLDFLEIFLYNNRNKDTLGSKRANRPVSELGERVKLS